MSRLRATLALGLVLAATLALFGATVRVPFVALGNGPTFDVLGSHEGRVAVDVSGPAPTYPVTGELRMTTVEIRDRLTLFDAMGTWASGNSQVLPRETVYPAGRSDQETDARNTRDFAQSETDAEAAALSLLAIPGTVQVGGVTAGSPSTGRLMTGDRILAVDGRPIGSPRDVVAAVGAGAPGRPVTVRVGRGGGPPTDVVVVAGTRPDGRPGGFLGITPDDVVQVRISLGDVGGPSAGLVFATAIVDRLTPGDLLGGRHVAGTGTIDAEGRVGRIGGIRFKLDAARRAGAEMFLVPAGNCEEAVSDPPDGLLLARVGTLAAGLDAVRAFAAGRPVATCA